ncbi:MAG: autotransporter outer membrane beta-barrel domain-containing protein [Sutterellaceae bacterium]|nr:autotransporter outer membrane beta-barrel domain-containing protein [Sutterellaceae bacterium]
MNAQRCAQTNAVRFTQVATCVALVILAAAPAMAGYRGIPNFSTDTKLSFTEDSTWVVAKDTTVSGNRHSLTIEHENKTKGGAEIVGTLKDIKDFRIVNGGLTVHKAADLIVSGELKLDNSSVNNYGNISVGSLVLADPTKRFQNGEKVGDTVNNDAKLHVENGTEKLFLDNYGTLTVGKGKTASFYGLWMKAGSNITDVEGEAVDIVIDPDGHASPLHLEDFHNESATFKAKNLTAKVSVKNLATMTVEGDLTAKNFETTAGSVTTVKGTLYYGDGPNGNRQLGKIKAAHINALTGSFEKGAEIEAQTLTVRQNLTVKTGGDGFQIGTVNLKNETAAAYLAFNDGTYTIAEMVLDSSGFKGQAQYASLQNYTSTLNIGEMTVTGGTTGILNAYASTTDTAAATNIGTLTVQDKGEFVIAATEKVANRLTIDSAEFGDGTTVRRQDAGATHTTVKELTASGLTVEALADGSTFSLGALKATAGQNTFSQAVTGTGENGQSSMTVTVADGAEVSFANLSADQLHVGLDTLAKGSFVATSASVGKTDVRVSGNLNKGTDAELIRQFKEAFVLNNANNQGEFLATWEEGDTRSEMTWDGKTVQVKGENRKLASISESTMVPVAQWRAEINDISLRLGDIRNQNGDNGLWVRTYGGRAKLGSQSVRFDSSSIQMGYDHRIAHSGVNYYVGGAFSYTDGETKFTTGTGDSSTLAFTAYASTLFDNGSFIDASIKYGKLKNEYGIRYQSFNYDGEYETQALGLTIELGHRFKLSRSFFVEPQVEGMFSHVFGEDYKTSHGLSVEQDGVDILIGRVGFMAGVQCPNDRGTVYVRGSYLYDFGSETSAEYSDGTTPVTIDQDLGGGWFEIGIGASVRLTDNLKGYADFIYSKGSDLEVPYRWNAGVRYTW